MALLNFKMGLQANLTQNSPAVAPGTIYVTTDERAMYVDVPAVEGGQAAHRIRLGDFRIYSTFEDLKKDKTDWSQSCLYYVADKNALARYNGTEWVLINDTASLNTAIQGVASRVVTLEGQLKGIDATEGAVKAYIDAADEAIGTRIGAVENRAKALEDAVGKDVDGETPATGLFLEIDTVAQKVAALEGFVSGGETGSLEATIDGRIDTKIQALDSEKSSAAVEAGKGLQVTVKQVDGKIDEVLLTGNFDEKYDAKGAANTVSQNLTQAIGELDTAYKAADLLINAKLEGIDTTVVAAIDAAKTAAVNSANSHADGLVSELKGGSDKTIKQLAEEIAGNDSDIAALQAVVGTTGLGGKVSALETAVNETIPATYETKTDAAKKLAEAKKYTDDEIIELLGKDGQVGKNTASIASINSFIAGTDENNSLSKFVDDKIDALDVTKASEGHEITVTVTQTDGLISNVAVAGNFDNKYDAKDTAKGLVDALVSKDGQVGKNTEAITQLQTAIGESGSVATLIDNKLTDKINTLNSEKSSAAPTEAGKGLQVTVKQTAGVLESVSVSGDFSKTYDALGSAEAVRGELNTAKQNLTDAINGVSGKVDTEKGRIDTILKDSTVKTFKEVEGLIASSIAANDAMVFKGVVTPTPGLPTAEMENGDTYKVAATGAYTVKADGTTEDAKVGDLFIYDGTAGEWRLIPSGGEDYKDPVLSAVDNKIVLTSSVTNQQVGTVEIVGANDSLTISTENNKITLALEWGTF